MKWYTKLKGIFIEHSAVNNSLITFKRNQENKKELNKKKKNRNNTKFPCVRLYAFQPTGEGPEAEANEAEADQGVEGASTVTWLVQI